VETLWPSLTMICRTPLRSCPVFSNASTKIQTLFMASGESVKRVSSRNFSTPPSIAFCQKLSRVEIPLDAGDFCVMKRSVVDAMLRFQEANPFLRGIRSWVGFTQIGVQYERAATAQERSRYTVKKYFGFALGGILSFSYIPCALPLTWYPGRFHRVCLRCPGCSSSSSLTNLKFQVIRPSLS